MIATFHLRPQEINQAFIQKLSELFADDQIQIVVSSSDEEEMDYPYNNPAQREYLLKAIADVNARKNMVPFDPAQFQ